MNPSESWRRLCGPLALFVPYAVTLVLTLDALQGRWDRPSSRFATLGVGAGLLGLTGFAVNIILGARLPFAPRVFGGLEPLYALHRINGRIAYLFILVHVSLTVGAQALGSVEGSFDLLTFGAGLTVALGLAAFIAMSAAIAATLYARLTHETFVYVQRSFGVVFVIGALHAFMTPGAKAVSPALTIYLAVLGAAALVAFAYRSLFADLLVRRFDYVVREVRQLHPSVVEISMEPVGRRLVARPGQFVFVTFYSDAFRARFHPVTMLPEGESTVVVLRPGDVRDQFHPFSLTSTPNDPHLSLVVKAVGEFTSALDALEPGAGARVEGPYGEFSYLNVRGARQIWIAGGIGITPFLSMARSLSDGFEATLWWGVNDRSQAFFAQELEALSQRLGSFTFHLVPEDEAGFITTDRITEHMDLEGVDVLIVGPPPMERALRAQLLEAGVSTKRIHSERFAFGPPRPGKT